jgi:hypothetical protein
MTQNQENPKVYPVVNQGNVYETGMDLLDHFAGLAMQGICADSHTFWDSSTIGGNPLSIASLSYNIAKAMIEERKLHYSK